MKKLLILIALITSLTASAQVILVTKKDSTQFETKINATSKTDLYVPEGRLPMSDLLSVSFDGYMESNASLYDNLRKQNVVVNYDYKKGSKAPSYQAVTDSPIKVAGREPVSLDQVVIRLNEFNNQRQTAKAMQLIGVLALGGSVALQAIYNQQYADDLAKWNGSGSPPTQNIVPSAVPIAGALLFTIGIGIDLGAGKQLKLVVPK
jgi:hypothetical protein